MVATGVNGVYHRHPLDAQLQATLKFVPTYAWYALLNGTRPLRAANLMKARFVFAERMGNKGWRKLRSNSNDVCG